MVAELAPLCWTDTHRARRYRGEANAAGDRQVETESAIAIVAEVFSQPAESRIARESYDKLSTVSGQKDRTKRNRQDTVALTWTSESLAETVWALNRLLRLAREPRPITLSPPVVAYRSQVEQWLRKVEPVLNERGESGQSMNVPHFPLGSAELEALEEEIQHGLYERIAHEKGRKKVRAREVWKFALSLSASLEHLHTTLQQAVRSSLFIIEAVVGLFTLNAIYLILVIVLRRYIPLTTSLVGLVLVSNLVSLLIIAGLWRLHHSRLQLHQEGLGWHIIHHGL